MKEPLDQRALLESRHKTLENMLVLYLTQAMLGLVSSNLQAVAIEVRPNLIHVHFVFREELADDPDDVEDILGDLDALLYNERLPDKWKIEPVVYHGGPDGNWPGYRLRRVYEAKPE
jgi:hypothetical protein